MCGVLYCEDRVPKSELPDSLVGFPSLIRRGMISSCMWVNIDYGLSIHNYGYVPHGAKCGESMVRQSILPEKIKGICYLDKNKIVKIHNGLQLGFNKALSIF